MDILQRIQDQLDDHLGKTSLLPADLETPFSNSAAANGVPGPHDVCLIDTIIDERNAQICSLALQMTNVDLAIHKLVAIRAKLEEDSARVRASLLVHQALTSPARRVPPEILGEIFYHCLAKTPYITPRDAECPMVLATVCRHWRAVAISTPRLWSSLSIYLEKTTDEAYRLGCESWLARAKNVPLTLRILNDIHLLTADPSLLASLVHWLRPLVGQASDLWWHGPSLPALFLPDPGFHLPLARLRVTTHRDTPAMHLRAQHLHAAAFQCLNYDLQSLDAIDLPWDRLRVLDMHFALLSATLFMELLARCTSLRTLVASCLCADEEQYAALRALPQGAIVHPTLRRLEIKVIRAGLGAIFSALTLPALEELDVCFCYRERDAWPHAAFMDMLARSRCALKRLTVRSNKTAVPYFAAYVDAMPGLAISTCVSDRALR